MTPESICELLPHDGAMCLVEKVVEWDADGIVCSSESHLRRDHPLRHGQTLSSIHGLEYAAQAMGVHAGLLAQAEGRRPGGGYLGAVREMTLIDMDLATLSDPLLIRARRLLGQPTGSIYEFEVTARGQTILCGRATVMTSESGE